MAIVFSATNAGILEQSRSLARVDAAQWPTQKVVNSSNNWHDFLTGYLIGNDKRFRWDDTNHTRLPIGTAALTISQSDYSFLTDADGNAIITLLGISILQADGTYLALEEVAGVDTDIVSPTFGQTSGVPTQYMKIADNIARLNFKPNATTLLGLMFFFQRTGSYFTAADTTKTPGVSPLLHRGYIIASAYDIALTLGTKNLRALSVERDREEQKAIRYFADRNRDDVSRMGVSVEFSNSGR